MVVQWMKYHFNGIQFQNHFIKECESLLATDILPSFFYYINIIRLFVLRNHLRALEFNVLYTMI